MSLSQWARPHLPHPPPWAGLAEAVGWEQGWSAVVLVGDPEVGWQWQPCVPVRCRGGSVGRPLPGLLGHGQHRHRALGGAGEAVLRSVIPALCQCGPESARRPPRRLPTVPPAAQTPSEPCGPEQDRGAEDAATIATHPEGRLPQCYTLHGTAAVPAEPQFPNLSPGSLLSPSFLLAPSCPTCSHPKSWSLHLIWLRTVVSSGFVVSLGS